MIHTRCGAREQPEKKKEKYLIFEDGKKMIIWMRWWLAKSIGSD